MYNFRCKICGEEFEHLPMVCPTPGCNNRNPALWENIVSVDPQPVLSDEELRELEMRKAEERRRSEAEENAEKHKQQTSQQAGNSNSANKKSKKKGHIKVFVIISILLILVIAVLCSVLWLRSEDNSGSEKSPKETTTTETTTTTTETTTTTADEKSYPDQNDLMDEVAKTIYAWSWNAVDEMEKSGFDLDCAAIFSNNSKNLYESSFFDLDAFYDYVTAYRDDSADVLSQFDYVIVLEGSEVFFVAVAEGYNNPSVVIGDKEYKEAFDGSTLNEIQEILADDISPATEDNEDSFLSALGKSRDEAVAILEKALGVEFDYCVRNFEIESLFEELLYTSASKSSVNLWGIDFNNVGIDAYCNLEDNEIYSITFYYNGKFDGLQTPYTSHTYDECVALYNNLYEEIVAGFGEPRSTDSDDFYRCIWCPDDTFGISILRFDECNEVYLTFFTVD